MRYCIRNNKEEITPLLSDLSIHRVQSRESVVRHLGPNTDGGLKSHEEGREEGRDKERVDGKQGDTEKKRKGNNRVLPEIFCRV